VATPVGVAAPGTASEAVAVTAAARTLATAFATLVAAVVGALLLR